MEFKESVEMSFFPVLAIAVMVVALLFFYIKRKNIDITGVSKGKIRVMDVVYMDNNTKASVLNYNEEDFIVVMNKGGIALQQITKKEQLAETVEEGGSDAA